MAKAKFSAGEDLTPLVGKTRMGDFVHANQTMAKSDGFKNVSKIWFDKTITFEEGLHSIDDGRSKTHDLKASFRQVKPVVNDDGKMVLRHADQDFTPTPHALGQLSGWSNIGRYIAERLTSGGGEFVPDRQDAETLVRVVENGLRRLPQDKPYLWRTREDGTLRALLSEKYSTVDNRWFLETLQKIIPGGRLSHWRGDSDTIYGNILIPDTIRAEPDSEYGGMVSIGNSEIGVRRVSSVPSIFRAICMNGCIWGQERGQGIKMVHRGKIDTTHLYRVLRQNIEKQIPLMPTFITQLLNTREMKWDGASLKPLFAMVATQNKLNKKQATSLLDAYVEERAITGPELTASLFGVVNTVTRAGQGFDPATWVQFDEIGGRLARHDESKWKALTGAAKKLSVDEVDEVFAAV